MTTNLAQHFLQDPVVEACRLDGYDNSSGMLGFRKVVVEACRLDGYDNIEVNYHLSVNVVEACRLDGYDNHHNNIKFQVLCCRSLSFGWV